MNEYIVHGALGLPLGGMLRIEDGPGVLICVTQGEIWLTEERDRRDRLLRAGQSHRLERNGVAIVHAFENSVIMLKAADAQGYARRIVLARGGAATELYASPAGWPGLAAGLRRWWIGLFSPNARPTTAAL